MEKKKQKTKKRKKPKGIIWRRRERGRKRRKKKAKERAEEEKKANCERWEEENGKRIEGEKVGVTGWLILTPTLKLIVLYYYCC